MYIPSEKQGDCRDSGKDTVIETQHWPKEKCDMFAGDFNAHGLEWDKAMEDDENGADKRGKIIQKWIEDTEMTPLNTGERTWTSRKEGHREMAPDITFVHGEEADQYQWKVLKKLGAQIITQY